MNNISESNPFSRLFNSPEDCRNFVCQQKAVVLSSDKNIDESTASRKISQTLEQIFGFTFNKFHDDNYPLIYLEDLSQSLGCVSVLDFSSIEQALFDRLMLTNLEDCIRPTSCSAHKSPKRKTYEQDLSVAIEDKTLVYLNSCYLRLVQLSSEHQAIAEKTSFLRQIIIRNCVLCLQNPDVFPSSVSPSDQFLSIYKGQHSTPDLSHFFDLFECVSDEISRSEEPTGGLYDVFKPILNDVLVQLSQLKLQDASLMHYYCDLVLFFTQTSCLGRVLLDFSRVLNKNNSRSFESCLLGVLLSPSCIGNDNSQFFEEPSKSMKRQHDLTEDHIHQLTKSMNIKVYQIFYNLLKLDSDVKERTLEWIGDCLFANLGRRKMWSNPLILHCSDGFCLNLCTVLLRLCTPFSQPTSQKLLRIQPTYFLSTDKSKDEKQSVGVHCTGLSKETCLRSNTHEADTIPLESHYSFVTECFFMAQTALNISFHVINERFVKINQDLHQLQEVFRDIQASGGEQSDSGRQVKQHMEKGMSKFLSLKAALTEPTMLKLNCELQIASASYLAQISSSESDARLTEFSPINFPLPTTPPAALSCIPEMMINNLIDFMIFSKRFADVIFDEIGEKINYFMTVILVFMGDVERVRNPHLRAHLAEALEALLPPDSSTNQFVITSLNRQQAFSNHSHAMHIAECLMNVFVSIEMTGQGVEFEQKFNYRRPMYRILKHIWGIEIHKNKIADMAVYAEDHIDDSDPPILLRFVNLLINDAIFLLDEALQFMSQIKEKVAERDSGEWEGLTEEARRENGMNLQHIGMLARFHNIMASDTLNTLEFLTVEIHNLLIHPALVDRIVSMLNYFLLHLVGPKKRALKVKDSEQYEFRPQDYVSYICQIYINLGTNHETFCQSVCKDGRSYSHALFVQAERVLQRLSKPPEMLMKFNEIAAIVKSYSDRQEEEETALADAPDEFLDSILGTLMKDPVILPSSGNIVDRSTIARHILSDQSDPFNRQPLTMDMIQPHTELKKRIDDWLSNIKN